MKAIKRLLGKLGFMYCQDCGTKLAYDYEAFVMGYGLRYECPHCDHLDRFDYGGLARVVYDNTENTTVSDQLSREDIKKAVKSIRKYRYYYIRCHECGVGVGATDDKVYRGIRREFVKAHWGHDKEEL